MMELQLVSPTSWGFKPTQWWAPSTQGSASVASVSSAAIKTGNAKAIGKEPSRGMLSDAEMEAVMLGGALP